MRYLTINVNFFNQKILTGPQVNKILKILVNHHPPQPAVLKNTITTN